MPARYGLSTAVVLSWPGGQLRAEPATQVSHGTFQTPPRPFQDSVCRPVPLVTSGSPSFTWPKTQRASDRLRFVQPCESFATPM